MKVVIEIARVYYDRILSQVADQEAILSTLKSAVTIHLWEDGAEKETMVMLCAVDVAKTIAQIAKQVAPDVAAAIDRSIYLAQFFSMW